MIEAGRDVASPETSVGASRSPGQWSDDDFDVVANGVVVGRIFKANAAPEAHPKPDHRSA
jgi:hypothetical protein